MGNFVARNSTAQTTTAGAVDTVAFSEGCAGFRVLNRGATDLWVRVDGTDPVLKGDDSYLVAPNEARTFMDPGTAKEIRLTSGLTTCAYTVEQLR